MARKNFLSKRNRKTTGIVVIALVISALFPSFAHHGFGSLFTVFSRILPGQTQSVGAGDSSTGRQLGYTSWNEQESPNYVRLIGASHINQELAQGQVLYSGLDALGRTREVRACITYQMMEDGMSRDREQMPNPSGWPSKNPEVQIKLYNNSVYKGRMWNRSHLLAKSLGGKEIIENLITGTRMQNVGANDDQGGMALVETAIRTWLQANPSGTVQFVATPVYEGEERIPRSVIVDVKTSDGFIDEEVEVYNAAKGYEINYYTGKVFAL
ncbi:MAG: DNA/RNA non-specific endonuclease [Atopobium sp.]|uniref:DNA/RNA non-specific endonuclease n=1 Tax=Atopobium sp. TaxID=1872650 RepID=UPI002A800920|nr:DNA/RNA non-specific endonuclease [Atopobium sp.]MDY4522639.1 DNA/RNA non-specific endonuclease [Atopobium sp.]